MSAIYAVILGIIQGITEFLPVSSFGHEVIVGDMLGMNRNAGLLFETMLHLGTLAALFLLFWKDIVRIGAELAGIILDLIGNLNLYIHNKRTGEQLRYAPIVKNTYRRLTVMLLVTFLPTALLGYMARRLAARAALSPLLTGVGFLITGVFLIVVDFSRSGGMRTPRNARYDHAVWIGIAQGISVFPGFSRCGLTLSAALFCGFSRKFAVKYSFLSSIPAVLGAFVSQLGGFRSPGMTFGYGMLCVLGMLAAGITGYLTAGFLIRLLQKVKFRYFAVYCFLAGVAALAWNVL